MATKNASGHQGEVKDPEHDGRLKGHKGGEAAKAHAEGSHPDEKDGAGAKKAGTKAEGGADHTGKADHGKADHGKADHGKADHGKGKADDAKAHDAKAHDTKAHDTKAHATKPADDTGSDDADLKSREYTDAQGNVHHHTKAYMESHKGG